jgi:hypothetical protein
MLSHRISRKCLAIPQFRVSISRLYPSNPARLDQLRRTHQPRSNHCFWLIPEEPRVDPSSPRTLRQRRASSLSPSRRGHPSASHDSCSPTLGPPKKSIKTFPPRRTTSRRAVPSLPVSRTIRILAIDSLPPLSLALASILLLSCDRLAAGEYLGRCGDLFGS